MGNRALFQMGKAESADQTLLRHFGECREKPNMDRHRGLRVGGNHQEGAGFEGVAAYLATDLVRHLVRENVATTSACRNRGGSNAHRLA